MFKITTKSGSSLGIIKYLEAKRISCIECFNVTKHSVDLFTQVNKRAALIMEQDKQIEALQNEIQSLKVTHSSNVTYLSLQRFSFLVKIF